MTNGNDEAGGPIGRALGVTRLARITSLDRCGIEVFSAVRPSGHVLQVSQGKGLDVRHAMASALGEAAELAAAERVQSERLEFFDGRAMVLAKVLGRSENEYVPADAVWCAPFGSEWLGPVASAWSTNGLASHPSYDAAVEHAVLEVIERDALARALPNGWVPATIAKRRLKVDSPLVSEVESRGFEVYAFDLSVDAEVSVAGVLLFDLDDSVVPLTAGYAARRTGAAAVEAALLEAAQSRLTEIHGAREDVSIGERADGASLRAKLKKQKPTKTVAAMPKSGNRPPHQLTSASLLAVDLLSWPVHVVKVIAPELVCSELV